MPNTPRKPRKTDTQASRSALLRRRLTAKGITRFGSGQTLTARERAIQAARGRATARPSATPTPSARNPLTRAADTLKQSRSKRKRR